MTRLSLFAAAVLAPAFAPLLAYAEPTQGTSRVPDPPVVHTHATAHRTLPNTQADVRLSIAVGARESATVTRLLGERSEALIAYLRTQGADRLQTTAMDVSQETHTVKGGPDVVVGYSGRITVAFRTTPDRMGALISGALSHGANTLEQATLSPTDAEIDSLRQALAREATRLAFDEARATADATGEHVTGVRRIDVDPNGLRMPEAFDVTTSARAFAAPAAPPPIAVAAGEQTVSVTVDLLAQIER